MNLLIVSHTEHYRNNGSIVGWGATVREIDQLSTLFDKVVHLAPLHFETPPPSAIPYESSRVELKAVPATGGTGLKAKLGIVLAYPKYAKAFLSAVRQADGVHVRCPANISMLAVFLLSFFRRPRIRWAKYAGNWRPRGKESFSYSFQRWWLNKGWHHGVTTVNGRWPAQPKHVHSFLNPCLNDNELNESQRCADQKQLEGPARLIFVGRLDTGKGVGRALNVMAELKSRGVDAHLDLIGDSDERQTFERMATDLGVNSMVSFHGWIPRTSLGDYYQKAHIMLLPSSSSEGWPKVLSEAMAYGIVPVCSNVSSIPQYLEQFGTGKAFEFEDVPSYAEAIQGYVNSPQVWKSESEAGMQAAKRFSYGEYLKAVKALLFQKKPV